MKRAFLLFWVLVCAMAMGRSEVPAADGREACVAKEVRFRLSKTAYKNVVPEEIRAESNYYNFAGMVNGARTYRGYIYMKFTGTRENISCDLEFRPNWILPNPWHVFKMWDDNDNVVASRMSELSVKGKRYRF